MKEYVIVKVLQANRHKGKQLQLKFNNNNNNNSNNNTLILKKIIRKPNVFGVKPSSGQFDIITIIIIIIIIITNDLSIENGMAAIM